MVRFHSNQLSGYCGGDVLATLKKVTLNRLYSKCDDRGYRSGDNPARTTRTLFPFDVLITSQYKAKHIHALEGKQQSCHGGDSGVSTRLVRLMRVGSPKKQKLPISCVRIV